MAFDDRIKDLAAKFGIDFGTLRGRVEVLEAAPPSSGGGGGGGTASPVWTVTDLGSVTTNRTLPAVNGRTLFRCILGASTTFTMPTLVAGAEFVIHMQQDATGGRSVAYGTALMQGSAPTAPGASARTFAQFQCDGSNWIGFYL